jgi:hypothetical protein
MENVDFKKAWNLLASIVDRSMNDSYDEIKRNNYKQLAYYYKQAIEAFRFYDEDSVHRKFDIDMFEYKLSSFEHRISVDYIYKPWEHIYE